MFINQLYCLLVKTFRSSAIVMTLRIFLRSMTSVSTQSMALFRLVARTALLTFGIKMPDSV